MTKDEIIQEAVCLYLNARPDQSWDELGQAYMKLDPTGQYAREVVDAIFDQATPSPAVAQPVLGEIFLTPFLKERTMTAKAETEFSVYPAKLTDEWQGATLCFGDLELLFSEEEYSGTHGAGYLAAHNEDDEEWIEEHFGNYSDEVKGRADEICKAVENGLEESKKIWDNRGKDQFKDWIKGCEVFASSEGLYIVEARHSEAFREWIDGWGDLEGYCYLADAKDVAKNLSGNDRLIFSSCSQTVDGLLFGNEEEGEGYLDLLTETPN